ncbi:hypothetical protein EPUL_006093 [Erysiphe pulchra]|uniref:Major facilitator superfamily (MFS) profile domain-containing protein n=1 Tax=Erysiphe pulchra TaxID=225359 RepID=A0A2S4PM49_9PEZI|nr:hypothetical protein EPUL_006093 [Erysiphe pulchra]
MPEVTDEDMGIQGKLSCNPELETFEKNLTQVLKEIEIANHNPGSIWKQTNLFLAVWSQFCYVGSQVAVSNYFLNFCEESGKSPSTSSNIFAAAQGLFTFNRFLAASLITFPFFRPRIVLATYLFLSFVFTLAAALTNSNTSIILLCLAICFESACFATIFSLGLRGLGRHTTIGGSLIVAAIGGGAVFPPLAGAVATKMQKIGHKRPFHQAMMVPMTGFIAAWIYPLYANIWNRELIDIRCETQVGIKNLGGIVDVEQEMEKETLR